MGLRLVFLLCGVSAFGGGDLPTLWAQQQIGADSLPRLIDITQLSPVNVGVFDAGFAADPIGHGEEVANLIRSSVGVSPNAVVALKSKNFWFGNGKAALQELIDQKISVVVVPLVFPDRIARDGLQNSADPFSYDEKVTERIAVLQEAQRLGMIVVISAGNEFPKPLYRFQIHSGGILVGSSTPEGLISEFSQEGQEVKLYAPADGQTVTLDKHGEKVKFGGTSAAAPLVAGIIATMKGIYPELSQWEVEMILQRTANHRVVDMGKAVLVAKRMSLGQRLDDKSIFEFPSLPRKKLYSPSELYTLLAPRMADPKVQALAARNIPELVYEDLKKRKAYKFLAFLRQSDFLEDSYDSADEKQKAEILAAAIHLPSDPALRLANKAIASHNPDLRAKSVVLSQAIGYERNQRILEMGLKDLHPRVREIARQMAWTKKKSHLSVAPSY